ncbi:hypothetical protein PR202_gb22880 [Eleusine coracana subsp. coracana]|uniref:Uncharacterized protein n=1 Tax=Eleusine coracana subsp. coracana TaxID=191504 RepID=A0AAV5FH98_ELECO|nr:hypothetical protein PR202_gb22880 [Eleusine coracana subsp. coracana]
MPCLPSDEQEAGQGETEADAGQGETAAKVGQRRWRRWLEHRAAEVSGGRSVEPERCWQVVVESFGAGEAEAGLRETAAEARASGSGWRVEAAEEGRQGRRRGRGGRGEGWSVGRWWPEHPGVVVA